MTSSKVFIIFAQILLLCACGASNSSVNSDVSIAALDENDLPDENCIYGNSFIPVPEKSSIEDVCRRTNRERISRGLQPLLLEGQRSLVAQNHSQDMSDRSFFDHVNPDGHDPFERLANANITYTTAAENIAVGQTTAKQVMDDWMKSSGHRANILNARFRRIGIGSHEGRWTQVFTD